MARRRPYPVYRRPTDREALSPHVLIAKGEVSVADKAILTQLLGRFGLSTHFMAEEEYVERERQRSVVVVEINTETTSLPEVRKFRDITSPSQYLVREHFDDFRTSLRPDISKTLLTNAVHSFISHDTRKLMTWHRTEGTGYERRYNLPNPMTGVKIAHRTEVGYDDYVPVGSITNNATTCYLAGFAIEAGSIIDATQDMRYAIKQTKTMELQCAIANQLQYQFEP